MKIKIKIVLLALGILAAIGLAGIIWLVREAVAAELANFLIYY